MPPPSSLDHMLTHVREQPQVRKAIAIDQVTEEPIVPRQPLTAWQKLKLITALIGIYKQAKLTMKKSSWKTTLGGILLAAAPVAHSALPPDWAWVSGALASIGALILGTSARDNGVTSEQAGATSAARATKPPASPPSSNGGDASEISSPTARSSPRAQRSAAPPSSPKQPNTTTSNAPISTPC